MALGILNQARWDWKGAEAAFRHALEISPGDPQIHQAYSNMLQWLGRFDEAIARMNLACGIDASIDPHGYWMGATYVNARRFDEAIEKTREFLRQFPGDPVLHLIMGFSYAQKGSCDSATTYLGKSLEISSYDSWIAINCAQMYGICGHYQIARELLNNYLRIQKGRPIESYNVASTYAILRDSTDAYAWLERAYQARSQSLNGLRIDVAWDSQRSNPRYLNMLRRIGLDR
jgi:tetratricopeptide (TPR) repeat protein